MRDLPTKATILRAKNMSATYSTGPKVNATGTNIGAAKTRRIALNRPPKAEQMMAVPRAFDACLSLPFIPSIAETLEFYITTGYPFRHA